MNILPVKTTIRTLSAVNGTYAYYTAALDGNGNIVSAEKTGDGYELKDGKVTMMEEQSFDLYA